jgi:hypothetical protein
MKAIPADLTRQPGSFQIDMSRLNAAVELSRTADD